jgi:hypothetical protein
VTDDHDPIKAERVEPGVEVAGMVSEAVGHVGLAGSAHPDEVGREQPAIPQAGEDVAPHVRGAGVAVKQHHGNSAATLLVVDVRGEHVDGGHRGIFLTGRRTNVHCSNVIVPEVT